MMGLINETTGTEARFGVGHFDLVIIDEAHRSVYQKCGAIVRYFDSLLVGLTATPRNQVDRNTYELFDLEPGVPTDAYELATAVADGYLVPPKVQQVDLRFPPEGIDYDSLSEEEQAQWESLDWGDDEDSDGLPERESWERLTASDVEILQREVAGLPSEIETDDIESRLFDLTALKMQLTFAEGDTGTFEQHRRRVVEIAMLLEEKSAITAVAAQLAYLASVQESAFWEGIALDGLEELRMRLRGLMPFLDKKTRTIVYTDFRDEIMNVREGAGDYLLKMTGVQYEKKVQAYLKNHLDHIVIHRLRTNQPLTATDLRGLEQALVEIGEDDGQALLTGLLARSDAPSLAHFVRSMVGMDRAAAQEVFSEFVSNRSLTTPQIRFIEIVIDQLMARGVMEPSALYEAPFSSVHAGGPEALFAGKSNVIEGIFEKLKALHPEPLADAG